MKARFEVFRDEAGEWRWRVRAANGQITTTSGESFASRSNARRAVAAFKRAQAQTAAEKSVDGFDPFHGVPV